MKLIKTEDAVGHVLCHDMTQIIRGVTKDARFRKGHIVTEEDIPVLLSMGKENLYVWEKHENMLHEDEAVEYLRRICSGEHVASGSPKEGKIDLTAACDGVLKIDTEKLYQVNSLGEMMIATRHSYTPVKKGMKIAGTRIIPLVIEKEKMEEAERKAGPVPIMEVVDDERFYDAFDWEPENGGFAPQKKVAEGTPATGAHKINVLVACGQTCKIVPKISSIYYFDPGAHTEGDGYLYQNRSLSDVFVFPNGRDGKVDSVYVDVDTTEYTGE